MDFDKRSSSATSVCLYGCSSGDRKDEVSRESAKSAWSSGLPCHLNEALNGSPTVQDHASVMSQK